MLFCCGALWAVTAATPLCSQIRIVPRAKLDSLAHPATADGAEAMPRLLLPADMTEASPHSPTGTA